MDTSATRQFRMAKGEQQRERDNEMLNESLNCALSLSGQTKRAGT